MVSTVVLAGRAAAMQRVARSHSAFGPDEAEGWQGIAPVASPSPPPGPRLVARWQHLLSAGPQGWLFISPC